MSASASTELGGSAVERQSATHNHVATELHVYAGAVHGFDMFADSAVTKCAAHDSADWLARQFR